MLVRIRFPRRREICTNAYGLERAVTLTFPAERAYLDLTRTARTAKR